MAVHKRGYSRYRGPITGHWARLMVVPRFAWERLLAQRLVVICLLAAMVWPLLCAGFIYVVNHSELWPGLPSGLRSALKINGNFFLVFMNGQSVFVLMLAALAGPGLIAPDLANNALPLYLSRPISRPEYVLAKLLVLTGLLSLVSIAPALLLFLLQAGMGGWSWFSANWTLGAGVMGGFLIWILLASMVALASSAYVRWRLVAGALVLGFFFVLSGVAQMVNMVFRVTWGALLDPYRAAYRIWCFLLSVDPPEGLGLTESAAALVVMALLLVLVLERKLRPVEVVS
jgi:ABC-2 type transport system permease protein